jgi:Putative Flp pilus-assembly TadE/G-like
MLAVIGLLYSFGAILNQRRAMQTAADAASLGGTWQVMTELASDNRSDGNVWATINRFALTNGAATGNVSAVYVDATGTQLGTVGGGGQFAISARGVRVSVTVDVATILPGFVKLPDVLVQDSATAVGRPTTPPAAAPLVIPVAMAASAYAAHATYDLFAHPLSGGQAPTLNLASAGAPTFGSTSTNEQYWSDGQHSGTWQLSQPGTVSLADAAYYDSIAAGLRDSVRRQALPLDSNGKAYGLFTAPVYDSATSSSVHIVGFVVLKIVSSSITSTSAPGTLVPYPTAAFGTALVPSPDLGACLVGISG